MSLGGGGSDTYPSVLPSSDHFRCVLLFATLNMLLCHITYLHSIQVIPSALDRRMMLVRLCVRNPYPCNNMCNIQSGL